MWIELPENVDVVRLGQMLCKKKIYIAIGSLFSASGKYRHCLRLNYAAPFTSAIEAAQKTLGKTVGHAMKHD